jgi:CspA family cold shock protein
VTFCFSKKIKNNMTGSIVRKTDKGFGFIKPDDGGKDVFFHAQNVVDGLFDELQENAKVVFDVEQGPKGPAATNVRLA